jgi:hypothetical protein
VVDSEKVNQFAERSTVVSVSDLLVKISSESEGVALQCHLRCSNGVPASALPRAVKPADIARLNELTKTDKSLPASWSAWTKDSPSRLPPREDPI